MKERESSFNGVPILTKTSRWQMISDCLIIQRYVEEFIGCWYDMFLSVI